MQQRIALIGLSGSGKTSVGPLVAEALGWRYIDTDQMIEQEAGRSIADFFVQGGEAMFRAAERRALTKALAHTHVVIATGAGMIEDATNRSRLERAAFCVWLHAPVSTLIARLKEASDRPLLSDDPETKLVQMAERRQPLYTALANWMIVTTYLAPQQIACSVIDAYRLHENPAAPPLIAPATAEAARKSPTDAEAPSASDVAVSAPELAPTVPEAQALSQVHTPGGSYDIRIRIGAWNDLPERLDQLKIRGAAWVISDTQVLPRYRDRLRELLTERRNVQFYAIQAGEQHKNLATVQRVYDWLLQNGVERGDVVLALGGGVVGDLAGFVAATVLRGIALVQLPTTVLAMVDSAIGGKTGVDHNVGKNLIGAFYQPRLVLGDTSVLATLPAVQRTAGWAEAIKHGVIGDAALFDELRREAPNVLSLHEPVTSQLLQRAAQFKIRLVSADEREHAGRIMLNYGHTLGHALEAESRYNLLHGFGVAIGMMAAGSIAVRTGLFDPQALEAQRATLTAFGLPTRIPPYINGIRAIRHIASDKKVQAQRVRWVLPTAIGAMTVRDDVPLELVEHVVRELSR